MAFQSTIDGAMAVLRFTGTQGDWANILWFSKPDFTTTDQQALAELIHTPGTTDWQNVHSSANSFQRVEVYDMRTSSGPVVTSLPPAISFGGTGGPLPLGVACVVTLRTALRGRSYRGRIYLAGFHEGAWDGTSFQVAVETAWDDWFTTMDAAARGAGWTWGVRSGQLNGVKREQGIVTPVFKWVFRNRDSASQRRRNRRL